MWAEELWIFRYNTSFYTFLIPVQIILVKTFVAHFSTVVIIRMLMTPWRFLLFYDKTLYLVRTLVQSILTAYVVYVYFID
jgi:hypothetical protein